MGHKLDEAALLVGKLFSPSSHPPPRLFSDPEVAVYRVPLAFFPSKPKILVDPMLIGCVEVQKHSGSRICRPPVPETLHQLAKLSAQHQDFQVNLLPLPIRSCLPPSDTKGARDAMICFTSRSTCIVPNPPLRRHMFSCLYLCF